MKLQLFKTVDALSRHQSTQACKMAASKAQATEEAPSNPIAEPMMTHVAVEVDQTRESKVGENTGDISKPAGPAEVGTRVARRSHERWASDSGVERGRVVTINEADLP